MPRLLFQKTGNAVWISHLDLMRVFQRAFKRAGLLLTHTQGFSPRPSVSIALPLSVGIESMCELLDFDLDGDHVPCEEILQRLNGSLIDGVKGLCVYEEGRKIRDLSLLRCQIILEYDETVDSGSVSAINSLFHEQTLVLPKKTKNGIQEQDIIPMIRKIEVTGDGNNRVLINALICCQNPTLNPAQLILAITTKLPHLQPNAATIKRMEVFDINEKVFR